MSDKYAHLTEEELNEHHNKKMAKKKTARDKMLARKTNEKGLVMVHTGKGKGKTTAAMGLAIRAIGNGMNVGIVQFVKGAWNTGEKKVFDAFPEQCEMYAMGAGFTWETQDREQDIVMAKDAWDKACSMMNTENISMVILDELNICLRYDYLDVNDIITFLKDKRPDLHVVITGRNAKDELIEFADLVTEMEMIKHHFRDDVKAQIGIEF